MQVTIVYMMLLFFPTPDHPADVVYFHKTSAEICDLAAQEYNGTDTPASKISMMYCTDKDDGA